MYNLKKKVNTQLKSQDIVGTQFPSLAASPSHSGLFRANLSPECWATYSYVLINRITQAFHG